LTICFPESDGAANHTSGNKNNQQFPPLTSKIPIQAVMEVVLEIDALGNPMPTPGQFHDSTLAEALEDGLHPRPCDR
jgi:hypothetical protein